MGILMITSIMKLTLDKEYNLKPFLNSKNANNLVYFHSTKSYAI